MLILKTPPLKSPALPWVRCCCLQAYFRCPLPRRSSTRVFAGFETVQNTVAATLTAWQGLQVRDAVQLKMPLRKANLAVVTN